MVHKVPSNGGFAPWLTGEHLHVKKKRRKKETKFCKPNQYLPFYPTGIPYLGKTCHFILFTLENFTKYLSTSFSIIKGYICISIIAILILDY